MAETVIVAKLHHAHLQIRYREVNINELTSHHMSMELTDIKYYGIVALKQSSRQEKQKTRLFVMSKGFFIHEVAS